MKKNGIASIVGLIALIVVLFVGINLVFAGLGAVIGRGDAIHSGTTESTASASLPTHSQSREESPQAPAYCPYCGEQLFEGFQWDQFCPYCGEQITGKGNAK